MEDNASRAIMIGVGIFVVLLVLTSIILYVNAARNMATVVDKGLNSRNESTVTNIMDYSGDISIKCTGIDFVNFLRKNFMREDIYITIIGQDDMQKQSISWWKSEKTDNVSEIKLAKIDIDATITMKKATIVNNNGVEEYLITVDGGVFSSRDAYVTDSTWEMKKDVDGRYAYVTDGKTSLQIGDSVRYANSEWKVLGVENRKILLLGNKYEVKLDASKDIELEEFNDKFASLDNGSYVASGSARCLSFRDIERLIDIDVDDEITKLTDKAKAMLSSDGYVFLMSISKENYSYTAKVLKRENNEVVVKDEVISNSLTCYIRPVIALEQYVSLTSTSQGMWSVSN